MPSSSTPLREPVSEPDDEADIARFLPLIDKGIASANQGKLTDMDRFFDELEAEPVIP